MSERAPDAAPLSFRLIGRWNGSSFTAVIESSGRWFPLPNYERLKLGDRGGACSSPQSEFQVPRGI